MAAPCCCSTPGAATAARRCIESLGFRLFGIVPGHACSPAGVLEDTSYMLKELRP